MAKIKEGDNIKVMGRKITGRVVDTSDPSLLTCAAPSGAQFKVGRKVVEVRHGRRNRKHNTESAQKPIRKK